MSIAVSIKQISAATNEFEGLSLNRFSIKSYLVYCIKTKFQFLVDAFFWATRTKWGSGLEVCPGCSPAPNNRCRSHHFLYKVLDKGKLKYRPLNGRFLLGKNLLGMVTNMSVEVEQLHCTVMKDQLTT